MKRLALLCLLFSSPALADVCPTYEAAPHRMIVAPHAGAVACEDVCESQEDRCSASCGQRCAQSPAVP